MKRPSFPPRRLAGLILAPLSVASAVLAQDPVEKTLELSSGERLEYIERAPFGRAVRTPQPLFVCLAPGNGDAAMVQAARLHLGDLAWKAGYLTVYPISTTGGFLGDAADGVIELIEHVADEHHIDPGLVVLAGLSNGGRAVFEVAVRGPQKLAALVAAPGAARTELDLAGLAEMPVWMRVGGVDSVDWRDQVRGTAERLEEAGALVDHAVIDGQGHVLVLGDQGLFEWLDGLLIPAARRVQFQAPDGLPIEAELYGSKDRSRPVIVLCHQARSSRGEYDTIAPRLAAAGYTCLAIDQRSGGAMNDVPNETARRAAAQDKAVGYRDARADIEAALDWIREAGFDGPLALWGSSYSASLVLAIGAEREDVEALLCFSPGEYFGDDVSVAQAAARVKCPVLVVSPESERSQSEPLVEALTSAKSYVVAEGIVHGSSTLFRGTHTEQVWSRVVAFLGEHLRTERDD